MSPIVDGFSADRLGRIRFVIGLLLIGPDVISLLSDWTHM